MAGFSIDLAAERIFDARTRSYFEEVTKSYSNGCYRSSLVMLWTVVVCDLVYKLQNLRDLYTDVGAGKLLADVEVKRATNPNSGDWESYLLDEVLKRTKILETAEYAQLQHLQKLRHLCAHPVLTAADMLFHPTKDTARAQIRAALEGLLLKPPLFSKRIIQTLIEDIAANRALLISPEKVKAYIEARYLPNMPRAIELELFRTLWKFCFKLNNSDAQANRSINTVTLAILYGRNPTNIRNMIDADRPTFSNIGPDAEPLDCLVGFLGSHQELHASLDTSAHILIDGRITADINNRVRARFKSSDLAAHLSSLLGASATELGKIKESVWTELLDEAKTESISAAAHRLGIKAYVESGSYDTADTRFARFIDRILPDLDTSTITELLQGIEANQQTYGRSRASLDHPRLKAAADNLSVDTTPYTSFTNSL
jgi:hypothetical protein